MLCLPWVALTRHSRNACWTLRNCRTRPPGPSECSNTALPGTEETLKGTSQQGAAAPSAPCPTAHLSRVLRPPRAAGILPSPGLPTFTDTSPLVLSTLHSIWLTQGPPLASQIFSCPPSPLLAWQLEGPFQNSPLASHAPGSLPYSLCFRSRPHRLPGFLRHTHSFPPQALTLLPQSLPQRTQAWPLLPFLRPPCLPRPGFCYLSLVALNSLSRLTPIRMCLA